MYLLDLFRTLSIHAFDVNSPNTTQAAYEEAIWRLSQQASILRAAPRATEKAIRSLGVITFNLEHLSRIGAHSLECAICLNPFCKGSKVNTLQCSHLFHRKCIKPWLRQRGTCPQCREPVLEPAVEEPRAVKQHKRKPAEVNEVPTTILGRQWRKARRYRTEEG